MNRRLFALLIIISSTLVAQTPALVSPANALAMGKSYSAQYLSGDLAALWPLMTSELQQKLKSPDEATAALDAALQQLGHESHVENERVLPILSTNYMMYTRLATFERVPMKLITTMVIAPGGKVAGLSLRPEQNPAESKYLNYVPKTALRFPLKGEWTIYQGGRSTLRQLSRRIFG